MVKAKASVDAPATNYRVGFPSAIFGFLILSASVCLGLLQTAPPRAVASDAAPTEFSSGRAMRHVKEIGRKAHPVGTTEHDNVRDYIIGELKALGVTPEVQSTTARGKARGFPAVFGTVQNVYTRVPGLGGGKIVALMAHYDTVSTGPGASDNSAGVAVLLETLRSVKAAAPLKNDLLFLFSDAEEVGLLGARAFVEEIPVAREIGLALNFDARGSSGPSVLFETSDNNGWLIREFSEAAPHPVSNSTANEIYKLLPNDTDLSAFKRIGVPGLNFAYIGGLNRYHTSLDDVNALDERSIQHQGTYALSLARHFGAMDFDRPSEHDRIYFDVLGLWLIHYSPNTGAIFSALIIALFILIVVVGWRSGRLKFASIAFGALGWLLSAVASIAGALSLWWVITLSHSHYATIYQADVYNGHLYLIAFICLTITIHAIIHNWLINKISPPNIIAGSLMWWAILMIVAILYLPGASYLCTWPLAFNLSALAIFILSRRKEVTSGKPFIVFSICAIPGILLMIPFTYLLYLAMSFNVLAALVASISLQLASVIPHIHLLSCYKKHLLPISGLVAVIAFIIIGSVSSGINSDRRQPYNLFYVMNADVGKAVWASLDVQPNEWTSQFFKGAGERGPLDEYFISGYKDFMKAGAPVIAENLATVSVLGDVTQGDNRSLHLKVASRRGAALLIISAGSSDEIAKSAINGKEISYAPGADWSVYYYGAPKDGIDVTLELKPPRQVTLTVSDVSYGLPEPASALSRPDYLMPSALHYSDMKIVTKSFNF